MTQIWKPHVTVAAVIERDQRFLLVEESVDRGKVFNQPAGHLEAGESILDAVIREVREETAWGFQPEALVAVQLWRKNPLAPSFLRFCFCGQVDDHDAEQMLDTDIISTHWLTLAQIQARTSQLRSALVLKSIEAYLGGQRYPLSLVQTYLDL